MNKIFLAGLAIISMTFAACGSSGGGTDAVDQGIGDSGLDVADSAVPDAVDDVARDSGNDGIGDTGTDTGNDGPGDVIVDEVAHDSGADTSDSTPADADDAGNDTTNPPSGWVRMPVAIEDEIVVGTNVMNPVDGLSFGYDPQAGEFITYYSHDIDNATLSYVWHIDESTWKHTKKLLSGEPLVDGTNFCMDENWCQMIGYDPESDRFVVLGPRAPAMMHVDNDYVAAQVAFSGTQPPNGAITYSHLFAWDIDRLLIYGYITGSGFGKTLHELNLSTGEWTVTTASLPEVFSNCLAWNPETQLLFSVGGLTTTDGGETSVPTGKLYVVHRDSGYETIDLPAELASREGMSCSIDPVNNLLYVSGGCVMNDNWNEKLNVYHNDLWVFHVASGTWEQAIPDGPTGSFSQYGDDWMFDGDPALPNFGRNTGRMMFDGYSDPRLILMGDVPGTATQIYTLALPVAE